MMQPTKEKPKLKPNKKNYKKILKQIQSPGRMSQTRIELVKQMSAFRQDKTLRSDDS